MAWRWGAVPGRRGSVAKVCHGVSQAGRECGKGFSGRCTTLVGQVGQAESSPGVALTHGLARGGSQISVPCEGFACSLYFNTPLTSSV